MKPVLILLCCLSFPAAAVAQNGAADTGNMSKTLHYLPNVTVGQGKRSNKDSADARITYRQAFKDAHMHAKLANHTTGSGFEIDNVLTGLINRISGKRKRARRFAEGFAADQRDRTLYHPSPDLIMAATHLPEDSARLFQQYCTLPVDLATGASQLELMMEIRASYKEWLQRPKQ